MGKYSLPTRLNVFDLVVVVFIAGTAAAGLLKYVGVLAGFPYLHLAPKIVLLMAGLIPFFYSRVTWRQIIVVCVALCWCAYTVVFQSLAQVAMGLWVMLPFWFAFIYPRVVLSPGVNKYLWCVLLISMFFEGVNYLTSFPWESMMIDYGDYSSSLGRAWSDNGVRRLAGISSSSIDLSLVIAISSLVLLGSLKGVVPRCALAILSFAAIYMTTMKTAAVAFLLAASVLLFEYRFVRVSVACGALMSGALGVALPLYGYLNGRLDLLLIDGLVTLQTRIFVVWPAVVAHVVTKWPGVFGLGIGGLGAAMQVGGNEFRYSFVDNMYLYAVGCGGVLGAAFIILLWKSIYRSLLSKSATAASVRDGALLIFIAIYGATQVSFEASMSSLFLGALVGCYGFSTKEVAITLSMRR